MSLYCAKIIILLLKLKKGGLGTTTLLAKRFWAFHVIVTKMNRFPSLKFSLNDHVKLWFKG